MPDIPQNQNGEALAAWHNVQIELNKSKGAIESTTKHTKSAKKS